MLFFFKQKTAYEMRISDWSSDVCSSDLGEVVLVTRAMERVTIANQVRNARFEGHGDHETAAEAAARVLLALGPGLREIGTEQWSSGQIGRASCRERVCQYV